MSIPFKSGYEPRVTPSFGSIVSGYPMAYPGIGGPVCVSGLEFPMHAYGASRIPPSRPLRVLHVGPSFVCAGVETWLRTLHRECDPRRMKIIHHTITDERCADHELLRETGIPWSIGLGQEFERACAEADVLLTWGPIDLAQRLPSRRPPLTVFVAHGVSAWTSEVMVSNHAIIDHVVAVSGKVAKIVSPDLPTTVILNGVNPAHLASSLSPAESREALGFSPDDFVVGFVGRLSPEKQVHRIIEALTDCDREVKFFCVGWGPLRAELLDRCNADLPCRHVFREARRDLGNLYQAMDAFCFPSHEEGFGLALAEAMYCGLPVIATNVGAAPELIQHQVHGVIVDGTSDSVRSAVETLRRYPNWRRGLAAEGRTSVLTQALGHQMARRYEQLLWQLWRDKVCGVGPTNS